MLQILYACPNMDIHLELRNLIINRYLFFLLFFLKKRNWGKKIMDFEWVDHDLLANERGPKMG